jgi:hypothetical protein
MNIIFDLPLVYVKKLGKKQQGLPYLTFGIKNCFISNHRNLENLILAS